MHKLFWFSLKRLCIIPAETTIPRRNRRFRSGQHFNYFTISTSFGAFTLPMIFPLTRLCSINITPKGVGYAPLTSFIPSGNAELIFILLQPADNTVTPSRYFVTKPTTPSYRVVLVRAKFDCRIHFGKTKITSVVLRQTKQHFIKHSPAEKSGYLYETI